MPSAATLRVQIEHALECRFPAALTPAARTIREVAATGIDEVDALLNGGLPVGAISELTGPESSGRTSLAVVIYRAANQPNRFVHGWMRATPSIRSPQRHAELSLSSCFGCDARNSPAHDLDCSLDKILRHGKRRPWTRLDQALRATDLLLQAGGFAAIVLDLGDTAPEHGNRIPLATWFRFRQAADRTRSTVCGAGQGGLCAVKRSSWFCSAASLQCADHWRNCTTRIHVRGAERTAALYTGDERRAQTAGLNMVCRAPLGSGESMSMEHAYKRSTPAFMPRSFPHRHCCACDRIYIRSRWPCLKAARRRRLCAP